MLDLTILFTTIHLYSSDCSLFMHTIRTCMLPAPPHPTPLPFLPLPQHIVQFFTCNHRVMRWILVHHLLILLQATQQNILIIMLTTPIKASSLSSSAVSTLKKAIELQLSNNKRGEGGRGQQERLELPEDELRLLENIEAHESDSLAGYMKYEDWMSFNLNQFPQVSSETANSLWKIIRIINYGEVAIPTGLIYELSYFFVAKNKVPAGSANNSLRNILDTFLSINRKRDSVSSFRELANYPSLQSIEKQYCPSFYASKLQQRTKTQQSNGAIFDRLHKEARTRDNSKQKMKYASMVKEMKECRFTPNISNYQSKAEGKKCERICKHTHVKLCPEEELPYRFSATKIDYGIFNGSIDSIPGAREHVKRTEASQAERQRIQRYLSKPWLKVR